MTFHIPFVAGRWERDGWHFVEVARTPIVVLAGEEPAAEECPPLPPQVDPDDTLRPVGVFGLLSL